MTSQKVAAVLIALCITSVTRGVSCCSDLVLTSSISGRNACLSEEVTFTCTAQATAVFWGHKAFGERTMHYKSPPSRGEFRAEIVSYDRNQSCLVSSLSFRATPSHNGTIVTCENRDRNSNQSLSLHIMSNVSLENLTVVPVSLSSVLLEWEVTPSDAHHCIRNYDIQVSGPNGSQWEEHIPGENHSFHFTGLQLTPLQDYTFCVTANRLHGQVDLKLTVNYTELQGQTVNFTERQGGLKCDRVVAMLNEYSWSADGIFKSKTNVWKCDRSVLLCRVKLICCVLNYIMYQLTPFHEYAFSVTANNHTCAIRQTLTLRLPEPHPPTNLSAVIQCKEGYEIQIDWQAPLPTPLGSLLTGYLLDYHVYNNTTTIELPALNTSYTLDSVPSGAVYNITVSALNDVGPSTNNPSVQFAVPSFICKDSLVIPENHSMECLPKVLIDFKSTDLDQNLCIADTVSSNECNCTNSLEENSTTSQECVEVPNENISLNQLTLCAITALTSGVVAFTCGSLIAAICNFATNQRKRARNTASRRMPTLSLHREQSPLYDDIIQMQNYCRVHHRENNPYVSPVSTPTYETIKL